MDNTGEYCDELIKELSRLQHQNEILTAEKSEVSDMARMLITKISHEFKTPLNSIIGFTELLKYKIKDQTALEYINTISLSSQHMQDLIRNIIDITSAQYNKLKLSYSIFNTKDVIEDIIKCFGYNRIEFTLIEQQISADYIRFKQLIYNLISNAIKFNKPHKPVKIITYIQSKYFYFEITDYGNGIKKENYKKIFELFTQSSDEKFTRQLSSGIGLSLCKAIVDAHLGKIYVKSKIDNGSTFIFKLPIKKHYKI